MDEPADPTTTDVQVPDVAVATGDQVTDQKPEVKEQVVDHEAALLKAIKAVNNKSPPPIPNTCLCSFDGQRVTCAAGDWRFNHIAYGIKDLNCIDFIAFKDFRGTSEATVAEKRLRLTGHSNTVTDLTFIPDSPYLLSSSTDCSIRLWDTRREEETHLKAVYENHLYPVWCVTLSPMSLYFASASADTTAKLWTTDSLVPIRIFASHESDVNCIRFHPNCNYVATGSTDRSVRLWSVNDGKCIRMFPGHKAPVFSVAFSPDGQFLASAGDDGCIKIWDLRSSNLLKEIRAHNQTISHLEWSPDGSLLVSSSLDASMKMWDTSSLSSITTSKSGNEKKWTTPTSSQFSSTPLLSVDTKQQRVIKSQFSCNNLLFAFALK